MREVSFQVEEIIKGLFPNTLEPQNYEAQNAPTHI